MARPSARPADAQRWQQNFGSAHISPKSEPSHQVFLSHAGNQKPLVSDLYKDLVDCPRSPPINPFFDQSSDSLPKGEEFPVRIFEAARKCIVAVVILTEDYVKSRWPMLELLAFVEAQKSTNPDLKLLPVFYNDLQNSGSIDASWIAAWESMESKTGNVRSASGVRRSTRHTITVESCKEALHKLRKSNGLVRTNNKPSHILRQEIVKAVLKFLPSSSEMDTEKVQGFHRLCTRLSEMFGECNEKNQEGPQRLGLYGMGGLGKTTLSKALCNYFGPLFNYRVCHLEIGSNEKDPAEQKFRRHVLILKRLSGLLEERIARIEYTHDYHQAENCVRQCLRMERVFLAVDNVQDGKASRYEARDYLKYLLFPDSKIIITSRSRETVYSVFRKSVYCKSIPYLEEEEAMTLFLNIAAPDQVNHITHNSEQTRIIRAWLRICFFNFKNDQTDHGWVSDKGGDQSAKMGHYHPLALQAVASYLADLYPEPDSILRWMNALDSRKVAVFHTGDSKDIFDVLGIGFENMCDLAKQLFIDVALYAPDYVGSGGTFRWLTPIYECNLDIVRAKLITLRKNSFLNFEVGTSSNAASYLNFSMHELYKEFAKRYLRDQDHGLSKYGAYEDGDLPPISLEHKGWGTVSRIYLQRSLIVAKAKVWKSVCVLTLVGCETLPTFWIAELVSLRHLEIWSCPMLEELNWKQNNAVKKSDGTTSKLATVKIIDNRSLRILPDFSNCSELQFIRISQCCRSVEPLMLHNCPNLLRLDLQGDDPPELQSLQSCPNLLFATWPWKSTIQGSSTHLEDLSGLIELDIEGPGFSEDAHFLYDLRDASLRLLHVRPLRNQLLHSFQQLKESGRYNLSVAGDLNNLQHVKLKGLPLGKLPEDLGASCLVVLHLHGCLLSELVDFTAYTSLRRFSLGWTNVEEVHGLNELKELEDLDFICCILLQKVPDLRPLLKLKRLRIVQCPNLNGIPRLPLQFCTLMKLPEDECRAFLAMLAFARTVTKPFPRPHFSWHLKKDEVLINIRPDRAMPLSSHFHVTCDGCMQCPILGPRYKAKPVETRYDLCSNCFSSKCKRNRCRTDAQNLKLPRWKAEGRHEMNFDLCNSCFRQSGCDVKDFYRLEITLPIPEGPSPVLAVRSKVDSPSNFSERFIDLDRSSEHFSNRPRRLKVQDLQDWSTYFTYTILNSGITKTVRIW